MDDDFELIVFNILKSVIATRHLLEFVMWNNDDDITTHNSVRICIINLISSTQPNITFLHMIFDCTRFIRRE
jgi:hypothetical protein